MEDLSLSKVALLVVSSIALIILLAAGCSTFRTVPSGSVGVITHFGATTGESVAPGLHLVAPFITGIENMDTQTHAYKASATAASRDLQEVTTEVTINFRLDPAHAVAMYNEMRRDYSDRLLVPAVQEAIKSVTARYDAEELITKRADVRSAIETSTRERLLTHHIILDQASITNFQFSTDFTAAIEAKVVATQNALKAENEVKGAKFAADARIERARGEAEAIKIQATAIQSQGGAAYVQLQAIAKWDGTLPTMMSGNTPVPFINIGNK